MTRDATIGLSPWTAAVTGLTEAVRHLEQVALDDDDDDDPGDISRACLRMASATDQMFKVAEAVTIHTVATSTGIRVRYEWTTGAKSAGLDVATFRLSAVVASASYSRTLADAAADSYPGLLVRTASNGTYSTVNIPRPKG